MALTYSDLKNFVKYCEEHQIPDEMPIEILKSIKVSNNGETKIESEYADVHDFFISPSIVAQKGALPTVSIQIVPEEIKKQNLLLFEKEIGEKH